MNHTLQLRALAKINLGLDVLGKRENGYHDVRMVMQTIYLYDNIEMRKIKKPEIRLETNLFYLPVNEGNIAYKAAKMLMDEFKIPGGVHIRLDKHIPVAAGMAGGSSNAAAVLVGMNRMFSLGLSEQELMERGVKLGADVPYCIMRGTVLAEGIGEELTPLAPLPKCYVLIAKPSVSVSTKMVYEKLDAQNIEDHPDIDGLIAGLKCQDIKKVAASMGNVLERVTIEEYPVIEEIKETMKKEGALNAMMSGSGPTVFGIFEDRQTAKRAQYRIKHMGIAKQVYLANVHNLGGDKMETNFEVNMNEYLPLRDVVFNTLRQAILRGELKPGERLMEIRLANKLGVSRTPIREAIRKLELEGLVLMIPRKGAEVADISEKSLRDVLEVREALEQLSVKLACDRIGDEEVKELKQAEQEFEETLECGDVTQFAEADVKFHDIIYRATDNERLIQLLYNLREQMYRYRVEYLKREDSHEILIAEHEKIIEAIERRDKEAAMEAVCCHIDNQVEAVVDTIRTKK